MTDERVRFDTDVSGIWGYWPTTPDLWSYSSLKEMDACALRWMLSRAEYPELWTRRGYPSLPVAAAIFGNVVHGVIERLANQLAAEGVAAPNAADVVGVLASLGGWRGIVLDAIERELERFEGNPRVSSERLERVRTELIRRAPAAADQVKAFLGRGSWPTPKNATGHDAGSSADAPKQRTPAGPGAHLEREVTSGALRLTGRIDLLRIDAKDVTVTDFKTGEEDEGHDEQVRLYTLLWDLDRATNPARRPASQLRVAYPSHERTVSAPTEVELRQLESVTAAPISAVDAVTKGTSPIASPSAETCQFCQVKHLCDAYWPAIPPSITDVSTEDWFDFEGRVLRPQGLRSWYVETADTPSREVLVRTVETNVAFPEGDRVRLTGVRRTIDPDTEDRLVISMVATSEWYPVLS